MIIIILIEVDFIFIIEKLLRELKKYGDSIEDFT